MKPSYKTVELFEEWKKSGTAMMKDFETGEEAEYNIYEPSGKYLRLETEIGDLYFRVEPITKKEFEEARKRSIWRGRCNGEGEIS